MIRGYFFFRKPPDVFLCVWLITNRRFHTESIHTESRSKPVQSHRILRVVERRLAVPCCFNERFAKTYISMIKIEILGVMYQTISRISWCVHPSLCTVYYTRLYNHTIFHPHCCWLISCVLFFVLKNSHVLGHHNMCTCPETGCTKIVNQARKSAWNTSKTIREIRGVPFWQTLFLMGSATIIHPFLGAFSFYLCVTHGIPSCHTLSSPSPLRSPRFTHLAMRASEIWPLNQQAACNVWVVKANIINRKQQIKKSGGQSKKTSS